MPDSSQQAFPLWKEGDSLRVKSSALWNPSMDPEIVLLPDHRVDPEITIFKADNSMDRKISLLPHWLPPMKRGLDRYRFRPRLPQVK